MGRWAGVRPSCGRRSFSCAVRQVPLRLHPHAALRGERGGDGRDDGHDEVEEGLPFLLGHGCRVLGISCCRRRWLVTVAVGTILAYQRP